MFGSSDDLVLVREGDGLALRVLAGDFLCGRSDRFGLVLEGDGLVPLLLEEVEVEDMLLRGRPDD